MKDDTNIPIPGAVDSEAAAKRREDYAQSRDLQAAEFNEAIVKRMSAAGRKIVKCSKCGKEFTAETISMNDKICPDCR